MANWYRRTWASLEEQAQRIDWHLDNWARWQRSYRAVRGYARGKSFAVDFDDLVASADQHCAMALQGVIEGLQADLEAALHVTYLGRPNRLGDLPGALERAREAVARGLDQRGVW